MEKMYCKSCKRCVDLNLQVMMDDNPKVKLLGFENGRPKFSVKHSDTTVRADCEKCDSLLCFSDNLPDCEVLGEV